jgi:hypothetical protein
MVTMCVGGMGAAEFLNGFNGQRGKNATRKVAVLV